MHRFIHARMILRLARLALGGALLATAAAVAATDPPAWIEKSNANAKVLLDATNHFQPEGASSTGIPGFDDQVADLGPGINERFDQAAGDIKIQRNSRGLSTAE